MHRISVVMSTMNTPEAYLRTAIESILQQSFDDFEFIIIDDGSTEKDREIVGSYQDPRIKLLCNTGNRGLAYALNRGIEAAEGKYILRMDSDDIALPNRLEIQYAYMEANPEVDIAGGLMWRFGNKKKLSVSGIPGEDILPLMYLKCRLSHPSVIIRKSFLDQNGLRYCEAFRRSQDYELWSRAMQLGKLAVMPDLVLKYRCHAQQATGAHREKQRQSSLRIYQAMLQRLNIKPSQAQCELHFALANAARAESPEALIQWAEELIGACQRELGEIKLFRREVHYRLLLNLGRHLLAGRYPWNRNTVRPMLSGVKWCDFVVRCLQYHWCKVRLLIRNRQSIWHFCRN